MWFVMGYIYIYRWNYGDPMVWLLWDIGIANQ